MKYQLLFCIIAVFSLFLLNQKNCYAQTPIQLDSDLQSRGITSPLADDYTISPINQENITTVQMQTNYYPDYKLSQKDTTYLLLGGILFIVSGTIFLTPALLLTRLNPIKKKRVFIIPNAVLQ
jgi:hypothetical protein